MKELGRTILIGSGAIGTSLRKLVSAGNDPVELLNLRDENDVYNLHKAYLNAGADILITNTFSANSLALSEIGMESKCRLINEKGVAIARDAAEDKAMVWASVGPLNLGLRIEDYSDEQLFAIYQEQCSYLKDADALVLETFVEPREASAAVNAALTIKLPVIFQIGNTGRGPSQWQRIDKLLEIATRPGITAVGVNCRHPKDILKVFLYISAKTNLPLTASANAGNARIERGVITYEFSPSDMESIGRSLADMGASVVGGCCGTTPEHIKALSGAIKGMTVVHKKTIEIVGESRTGEIKSQGAVPNKIRELMRSDEFLISVEIRADRTQTMNEIVAGARKIAAEGADMFSVPDNPGAMVGRDAAITAYRLQKETGIPSIAHFAATQANMAKIHSMIIGFWDLGLRAILAITGDAPSMGHLSGISHRVTDIRSSVELMRLIRQLREGQIINGEKVADSPDFCVGCAFGQLNEPQKKWLEKKVGAGAEFVFSQPIFTNEACKRLLDFFGGVPVRFFPGVMPLVSKKNAEFLAAGHIPGIVVPSEVVESFSHFNMPEDQRKFGIEKAIELAQFVVENADGLYLIMPFGKKCYDDAAEIVAACRKR